MPALMTDDTEDTKGNASTDYSTAVITGTSVAASGPGWPIGRPKTTPLRLRPQRDALPLQLTCSMICDNCRVDATVTDISIHGFHISLAQLPEAGLSPGAQVQGIVMYGESYVNLTGTVVAIEGLDLVMECTYIKREQEILLRAIMLCHV